MHLAGIRDRHCASRMVTTCRRPSGPGWTGSVYMFTATMTLPGPFHMTVSSSGTVDVDQQGRVRQRGPGHMWEVRTAPGCLPPGVQTLWAGLLALLFHCLTCRS